MAFKRVDTMDVYEVIRRWHDKQKITHIGKATSFDRKTVRKYIAMGEEIGLSQENNMNDKAQIISLLKTLKLSGVLKNLDNRFLEAQTNKLSYSEL